MTCVAREGNVSAALTEQEIEMILDGYKSAAEKAQEILKEISLEITPEDENILKKIAVTAMTGKGAEGSKEKFSESGINLNFLRINEIIYHQGKENFIPNLSIIDVLMWNSKEKVVNMLQDYILIG